MRLIWFILFSLLMLPYQSYADTDHDKIKMILKAIEKGWEQADGTPFREHFLDYDGARYVESGGQNIGLTDLIEHHVKPEGKSLKLDLNFNNPLITIEGDFAWMIVDMEVNATIYKTDRKIHNKGFETIILRKIDDEWKVLHTHSSSRPVKEH
ncbi:MAG: nuclear transport factor 2 family protein [Gammaproteobacteria bacterium]|nr:nuclear transport factor 2 family protein [Gammaproteobacteria bacterium]